MKRYNICFEIKDESCFNKDRYRKIGLCHKCRKCCAELHSMKREERKLASRAYYHKNRLQAKNRMLNKKYGLSLSEYEDMCRLQSNKCLICNLIPKVKELVVDHSHKTAAVRGLLCMNCNAGLGQFKDSVELFQRAIQYLNGELNFAN